MKSAVNAVLHLLDRWIRENSDKSFWVSDTIDIIYQQPLTDNFWRSNLFFMPSC